MGNIKVKLSGKRKLKTIQAFAVYVLLGFNKMPIGELSLGTFVGRPNRKKQSFLSNEILRKAISGFQRVFSRMTQILGTYSLITKAILYDKTNKLA